MSRQQRIIDLQNEIARLRDELDKERAAYVADALEKDIRSEVFGDWKFQVQRNPARLDLVETAEPGQFYKLAMNRSAIRQYLVENGAQPWGTLSDAGSRLVVKRIHDHTADS